MATDVSKPGWYRGVIAQVPNEAPEGGEHLNRGSLVLYYSDRNTPPFAGGKLVLVQQENILAVFND